MSGLREPSDNSLEWDEWRGAMRGRCDALVELLEGEWGVDVDDDDRPYVHPVWGLVEEHEDVRIWPTDEIGRWMVCWERGGHGPLSATVTLLDSLSQAWGSMRHRGEGKCPTCGVATARCYR